MTNFWNRCTGVYIVFEAIVGLAITVLGIIFERNRAGALFTNAQQERFAHLVLSYGCLVLVFSSTFGLLVLTTFHGFSLLSLFNTILGAISIAFGILVLLKPLSILQHGYIEVYFKTTIDPETEKYTMADSWPKILFFALAIFHGVMLILHAIATCIKRAKVKPHWREIKNKAAGLQTEATKGTKIVKKGKKDKKLGPKSDNNNQEADSSTPDKNQNKGDKVLDDDQNNNGLGIGGGDDDYHPKKESKMTNQKGKKSKKQFTNTPIADLEDGTGGGGGDGHEFDLDIDPDEIGDEFNDNGEYHNSNNFDNDNNNASHQTDYEISINTTTTTAHITAMAPTPSVRDSEVYNS